MRALWAVCLLAACAGPQGAYEELSRLAPAAAREEARVALRRLGAAYAADPVLLGRSLPLVARLARSCPWILTRAQAVRTLGRALAAGLRAQPEAPGEAPAPEELPALARALEKAREPAARRRAAARLTAAARRLLRQTLTHAATDPAPLVRATAARVLAGAAAPWAGRLLLERLDAEKDPDARRAVFRSLEAYRTPAVAAALLAVLEQSRDPREQALARRSLLSFTRRPLGEDPAAWRRALQEAGYLRPQSPR